MTRFFTLLLPILFLLAACKSGGDPAPELSTNPDDCVLNKIVYNANLYDGFTYDSRGLMTTIQTYANGQKTTSFTNTFDADGKLVSQVLNGAIVRYVYSGTTVTTIQLLADPQTLLGEYVLTYDASGRIGTVKVQNTAGPYAFYEGYQSVFTYDSQGNCTQIDVTNSKKQLVGRVVSSDFVAVRSFVTKFKNQYFIPFNSPVDNLYNVWAYKFPNTSPNRVESYSALDAAGNYTGTLVKTETTTYVRTPNASGMMVKRVINGTNTTTTYEYSGCQ